MRREFISYPKSGRSWVRYMLDLLGLRDEVLFHHDQFEFSDAGKPPHDFDLAKRFARYASADRLVYLERDPRDVMVSLYHQVTGRFGPEFDYRRDLSAFIRDPYFGAKNLRGFRDMWREISERTGALRICYEDCHCDTLGLLTKVVDHFGFTMERERLAQVVADSTFESMRRVEESDSYDEPWLRRRHGAPKLREGKVGGFRQVLSSADVAYLNEVFGMS